MVMGSVGNEEKEVRVMPQAVQGSHISRCPRCRGAMVMDRFQDMLSVFHAWRCLNCGNIVYPEVEREREERKDRKKAG